MSPLRRRSTRLAAAAVVATSIGITSTVTADDVRVAGPIGRTASMPGSGDVADDPVIWVDPVDSSRSVIIGTNKSRDGNGGLYAFTATGARWSGGPWQDGVNRFDNERYNNVDLRYDVKIGGERWDLVAASNRSDREIDVFRVDTDSDGGFDGLTKVGELDLGGGLAPGTDAPYGLGMTQHPDGSASVFISDKEGRVAQYRLTGGDVDPVDARRVGLWDVSNGTGPVEGIVADDDAGVVYFASENRSIDRFETDAAGVLRTSTAVRVASVGGSLTADIEGLALYRAADGAGYLLASSQGSDRYVVFDRAVAPGVPNREVATFRLRGVTNTDGIDVVNVPLGDRLPHGAFIAHDGEGNSPTKYAIVSWSAIARGDLIVDTDLDPRS